jgi:hypothetical protein
MEQFYGHTVSPATRKHAMMEAVFSIRSEPGLYNEDSKLRSWHTRVEAGSNTSTVSLRVVGGDEKGSLESETVKYGHEFYGTGTRK